MKSPTLYLPSCVIYYFFNLRHLARKRSIQSFKKEIEITKKKLSFFFFFFKIKKCWFLKKVSEFMPYAQTTHGSYKIRIFYYCIQKYIWKLKLISQPVNGNIMNQFKSFVRNTLLNILSWVEVANKNLRHFDSYSLPSQNWLQSICSISIQDGSKPNCAEKLFKLFKNVHIYIYISLLLFHLNARNKYANSKSCIESAQKRTLKQC